MSDATRKMVFKQATQKALFRGVTFATGWSHFWKNVWAQKPFPFSCRFFFSSCVFFSSQKCHFTLREDVRLCETLGCMRLLTVVHVDRLGNAH